MADYYQLLRVDRNASGKIVREELEKRLTP